MSKRLRTRIEFANMEKSSDTHIQGRRAHMVRTQAQIASNCFNESINCIQQLSESETALNLTLKRSFKCTACGRKPATEQTRKRKTANHYDDNEKLTQCMTGQNIMIRAMQSSIYIVFIKTKAQYIELGLLYREKSYSGIEVRFREF